jgi:hypothetical protein
MSDRRPQLGSETGQTAAEAMGVLLLVSLIIAALVISASATRSPTAADSPAR